MSNATILSPEGAARRIFRLAGQADCRDPATAFLDVIRRNVRSCGLEDQVVHLAFEVASWQGGLDPKEREAALLLVLCSLISVQQGSTRVPALGKTARDHLGTMIRQLTGSSDQSGAVLDTIVTLVADRRLPVLIGGPGEFKPLILEGPYLYPQKMYDLENRLAIGLRALAGRLVAPFTTASVDEEIGRVDGRPLKLSGEQRTAVRTALLSPLTVISGGPGTGKTSIIVSILRVLCRLAVSPESIALTAPTGKAASRMAEAIRNIAIPGDGADTLVMAIPAPRTLHRLLGYSPASGRFSHHRDNRLPEQVVIVDETSMVDLFLMERLISSLRDDARLILIGDAGQLPSVEAGSVLRDILPDREGSGESPLHRCVVMLRRNFRMSENDPGGSAILAAAGVIHEGRVEALFEGRDGGVVRARRSVDDVRFEGVEMVDSTGPDETLRLFLDRWHHERFRALDDFDRLIRKEYTFGHRGFSRRDAQDLERLFDHFNSFRILCPTRVSDTGAEAMNRFFHRKLLQQGAFEFQPLFVPGEPILMEHNDYGRNIFNGDHGIVLRVANDAGRHHFMAVFRRSDDFGVFHIDSLRGSITHAFAMTVHKSQGSEFDHVALIMPQQEIPLLTRELLYTAVTRSRKSVTILGKNRLVVKAVQCTAGRFSGIAERLSL